MLGLYPFAPSVFHSPFDFMEDDFGWPLSHRRYVLPRRRYIHRHAPYDVDSLIDDLTGLTSAVSNDHSPLSDKTRRRCRSRTASPRLSPRKNPTEKEVASSKEKSDAAMTASTDSNNEVKTAEASTPTPQTSMPTPTSFPVPVEKIAAGSNDVTSPTPTTDTAVTNANNTTEVAPKSSQITVSPFRLIKQLNGLQLSLTSSDTAYTVTTPIPSSINKSDLQLSIDHHVLTLSAQINSSQVNEKGKTESSSRVHISRSIRLNRDANTDAINAHFSDGQLTITVPRIPAETKQTINIE